MAKIDAIFFERAQKRFNIKFKNVLDIGAAAGDWSGHVKKFNPDAKFTLIEPNKLHNERLRSFRNTPVHDWSSHAADGFRYLAVGLRESRSFDGRPPQKTAIMDYNPFAA